MMLIALFACETENLDATEHAQSGNPMDRAWVVSEESNELFVFDYKTLETVGSIDTTAVAGSVNGNHMAMVTPDGSKVYITAAAQDILVVVDAETMTVSKKFPIGKHATHMAFRDGTSELWVMAEDDNAVVVVDTETDEIIHTVKGDGMFVPHFARFSGDFAYIPSIGGNQISIIDLATHTYVDAIVGDGLEMGACEGDPCGYADAQIDPNGVLFASNFSTGKVIVYDTVTGERKPDATTGGGQTWSAFVNPFSDESYAFAPSWVSSTVSRIGGDGSANVWTAGDSEVYGVNFSAQAPGEAFVLSRTLQQVRVLDATTGEVLDTLDVGGTTETGTTTPDGRLLLPISSEGAVAVIDTATHEEIARFEGVGEYPWSVTTAEGQNYCH